MDVELVAVLVDDEGAFRRDLPADALQRRAVRQEGLGPVAPRIQKSRNFDLVCEPVSPDGLDGFVDIGFTDKCELPASAASARPRSDSELSEAFGFQPNETRWL